MKTTSLIILLSVFFLNASYSQKLKKIKKVDPKAKIFESYDVIKDDQNIKNGNYLFRFAGQVQVQGQYLNNLRTGEWIYTPGDNIKITGSYTEDQRTGEWRYYRNDKLISSINYNQGERTGKSFGYHENGVLACELDYADGKISGIRKAFYDDGTLKSVINYTNGKFNGDYEMYSDKGKLLYTIIFKDGVPYNLNIITENRDSIFVGGDLNNGNGQFITYSKIKGKRNINLIRTYKDGKLNGQIKGYNYKGEISYRGQYMNGFMVGMWNFNLDNPSKRKDLAYTFADSIVTDTTKIFLSKKNSVFDYSEKMPKFDNSSSDQFRYFISSVLQYPYESFVNKTEGKVFTNFIINDVGKIVERKVIEGVDPYLDAEALRVLELSPYWIPGFQDQIPVSVNFTFPIVFQLQR